MDIRHTSSLDGIGPEMLSGFFEGWPSPPTPEQHLRILEGSSHVVLAIDDEAGRVVGFINALGDGVNSAFIPLIEVLPEVRGRGIGSELLRRMLDQLEHYPCIDLTCDAELQRFYEKCEMQRSVGMVIRDYSRLEKKRS